MRCGCPQCGAFMAHAEDREDCVCPDCGHRCSACLGTNTVWSRQRLAQLKADPQAAQVLLDAIESDEAQ